MCVCMFRKGLINVGLCSFVIVALYWFICKRKGASVIPGSGDKLQRMMKCGLKAAPGQKRREC